MCAAITPVNQLMYPTHSIHSTQDKTKIRDKQTNNTKKYQKSKNTKNELTTNRFVDSTPIVVLRVISLISPLSFSKGISDLAVAGAMGGIFLLSFTCFFVKMNQNFIYLFFNK